MATAKPLPPQEAPKKAKPNAAVLAVQRYMQFASAHDDTLVLKSGGIRAIVEVGSVNFNLKSADEQNAIIATYQQFLNALSFPVQILIKSRKLDIDSYLADLTRRLKSQQNELLRDQMRDYIDYVTRLVQYSDIMEKRFFCIVPYDPYRAEKKNLFERFMRWISPDDTVAEVIQRRKEFATIKKELDTRVNIVTTALSNCGLSIRRLSTAEIVGILYQSYNPELARHQKFRTMDELAVSMGPEESLVPDA